ncbi:Panacea domain-containing protein [Lachnospira multipara]|uniref:Uncharacterized phage-associated protein n=1 Tax=Lachnospira multipara TaxID=28051 RepID=A0A1H5VP22_9FIRM|nr:type II toxin-antitoxin system antitoxin SocA domain-containing protein [Lachnospira multipara]SEF89075.1 Uncharacterized phage-associated protein [Lachnospira multipara]
MYSAMDLSKYIILKCIKDGYPISNLQLQRILYYIQKDFLKRNEIAFPDNIEAWQFGPVVPNVYYHYCGFGSMRIFITNDNFSIADADALFIDKIVEEKRQLEPWDAAAEIGKVGGAWAKIYNNGLGNYHIIPTELIKING